MLPFCYKVDNVGEHREANSRSVIRTGPSNDRRGVNGSNRSRAGRRESRLQQKHPELRLHLLIPLCQQRQLS